MIAEMKANNALVGAGLSICAIFVGMVFGEYSQYAGFLAGFFKLASYLLYLMAGVILAIFFESIYRKLKKVSAKPTQHFKFLKDVESHSGFRKEIEDILSDVKFYNKFSFHWIIVMLFFDWFAGAVEFRDSESIIFGLSTLGIFTFMFLVVANIGANTYLLYRVASSYKHYKSKCN